MPLPARDVLNDQYTIRKAVDEAGPFKITYLAWSLEASKPVVLTEYFPTRLVERAADGRVVEPRSPEEAALFQSGLNYFLKEAALLREIEHPSLPGEHAAFKANGTAYRVSRYHPGKRLSEALRQQGGSVSEQTALKILIPVLGALDAAHERGLLHGGLTPAALYLAKSRRTLLTGFQSARIQLARKSDTLADIVHPGTSAPEQYARRGRQGPWTDVYAAAATLYQMVTGQVLPEAPGRSSDDDPVPGLLRQHSELSEGVKNALMHALALAPKERVQSAEHFRQMLEAPASVEAPAVFAIPTAPEEAEEEEAAAPAAEAPAPEATSEEAAPEDAADTTRPPAPEVPAKAPSAEAITEAEDADEAEDTDEVDEPLRAADRAAVKASSRGSSPFESRKAAMVLGIVVLLCVMAGGVLAVMGGNEGADPMAEYAQLRAEADSLFEQADYAAAGMRYTQALSVRPDEVEEDAHITQRLNEIEFIRSEQRKEQFKASMARADSLETQAAALAEAGDEEQALDLYAAANEAYLLALDARPSDSLAFAKAQQMNALLTEADGAAASPSKEGERTEEANTADAFYARHRQQGDAQFERGQYEAARREFTQALTYRPGDAYATQRIEEIDALLSEAERKRQYARYLERGDSLLAAKQYAPAQHEYELALKVRPGDRTAQARLDEIKSQLAQAEQDAQQYQYHRAQGDVFFSQGDFEAAVESYKRALTFRPGDTHVQSLIGASQQRLEAQRAEEEREANMQENGIYTVVDEEPKLIGGLAALHEKVEYPKRAARRGVEGRVVLRFVVEKDGSVRDVEVIKGIGSGADEEAVRAVREARFEPARVNGEPVASRHSLWIRFMLAE